MLAISSCLGLLPSWVRDEIEVSPTSRYMKWLAKEYNLTMTKETAEQITESLVVLLSHRFGGRFSKRKIENILCKVYRRKTNNKSDERFCDLIFAGQMLFSSNGDGEEFVIKYPSGKPPTIVSGGLVREWPLGRDSLGMVELLQSIGILGNGLPSLQELSSWSVPNALMFGKANRKKDYILEHRVRVQCRALLASKFDGLSRKLRL